MFEFQIGADPELVIKNKDTGKYVSAHDLIPGTKEHPHVIPYGAIQVDGVAAEYNIDPAKTVDEFINHHQIVVSNLNDRIYKKNPNLYIDISPTATFDKDYFESLPDDVRKLGCDPDFDAWTGEQNTPPETKEPFRTFGGHIHCGWGEFFDVTNAGHILNCRDVVKQLDMVLYRASLLWDKDEKRRELYGKMGAFRPKHYGVEYRSLSNAFLKDEALCRWVFIATRRCLDLLFNHHKKIFEDKVLQYVDGTQSYFAYLAAVYGILLPPKEYLK